MSAEELQALIKVLIVLITVGGGITVAWLLTRVVRHVSVSCRTAETVRDMLGIGSPGPLIDIESRRVIAAVQSLIANQKGK